MMRKQAYINNAAPITRIRMISPVKKNDFAMAGLPLGADNYGKVIGMLLKHNWSYN